MSQQDDSAVPTKGRILAIDPGERRIGVAAADLGLRVAIPLTTIEGGPDAGGAVAPRGRGGGRRGGRGGGCRAPAPPAAATSATWTPWRPPSSSRPISIASVSRR